jgi:DNA-binding GntR family transcriptional regulator
MTALTDQHERAIDAIGRRDGPELRRAIEADIAHGMGLIGRSGFERMG